VRWAFPEPAGTTTRREGRKESTLLALYAASGAAAGLPPACNSCARLAAQGAAGAGHVRPHRVRSDKIFPQTASAARARSHVPPLLHSAKCLRQRSDIRSQSLPLTLIGARVRRMWFVFLSHERNTFQTGVSFLFPRKSSKGKQPPMRQWVSAALRPARLAARSAGLRAMELASVRAGL
jgi:hypothetical protein